MSTSRIARRMGVAAVAATCLISAGAASAAPAPTVIRLDGIGPLRIGMTQKQAVATGWLSTRMPGCSLESPQPVMYRLNGRRAPKALTASATFQAGKLRSIRIDAGGRTKLGIAPGRTTVRAMVAVYRRAGFRVSNRWDEVFQVKFIDARRAGRSIAGLAAGTVVESIWVPFVETCD